MCKRRLLKFPVWKVSKTWCTSTSTSRLLAKLSTNDWGLWLFHQRQELGEKCNQCWNDPVSREENVHDHAITKYEASRWPHWNRLNSFSSALLCRDQRLAVFNFGTDRVRVLEKTSGSGSGTDRVRVLALHFYQSGIIGYWKSWSGISLIRYFLLVQLRSSRP